MWLGVGKAGGVGVGRQELTNSQQLGWLEGASVFSKTAPSIQPHGGLGQYESVSASLKWACYSCFRGL